MKHFLSHQMTPALSNLSSKRARFIRDQLTAAEELIMEEEVLVHDGKVSAGYSVVNLAAVSEIVHILFVSIEPEKSN